METEYKIKRKKMTVIVETADNGFTIWVRVGKDTRWVIDASSIKEDGLFSFGLTDFGRFTLVQGNQNIRGDYSIRDSEAK